MVGAPKCPINLRNRKALTERHRAGLHGVLTGDMRNGPVTMEIFYTAPDAAKTAFLEMAAIADLSTAGGLSSFDPGSGVVPEKLTAWLFGAGGAIGDKCIRIDYDPDDEPVVALPTALDHLGTLLPFLKAEEHDLRIVHDHLHARIIAFLEPRQIDGHAPEDVAPRAGFPGDGHDECISSCRFHEGLTGAGSRCCATRLCAYTHAGIRSALQIDGCSRFAQEGTPKC